MESYYCFSPLAGGLLLYERLVSMSTKTTGQMHSTLEQLSTLLAEIEAVLNSRPLTYVYEDFESGFVTTLSHFLVMNRKLGLPAIEDEYFKDADCLRI